MANIRTYTISGIFIFIGIVLTCAAAWAFWQVRTIMLYLLVAAILTMITRPIEKRLYPGINRLDYDYEFTGGVFPRHIESLNDEDTLQWLENILYLLPVASRPDGYNPLGEKNLSAEWATRLGNTGKDCFNAVRARDIARLGASMNDCMRCWAHILPQTVKHPKITANLPRLLRAYQAEYPGAMYSGCGGGYLLVVSEKTVPGGQKITIRRAKP